MRRALAVLMVSTAVAVPATARSDPSPAPEAAAPRPFVVQWSRFLEHASYGNPGPDLAMGPEGQIALTAGGAVAGRGPTEIIDPPAVKRYDRQGELDDQWVEAVNGQRGIGGGTVDMDAAGDVYAASADAISRFGADGSTVWTSPMDGTVRVWTVAATPDGGAAVVGSIDNGGVLDIGGADVTITPPASGFVAHYTPAGHIDWAHELVHPADAAVTRNGDVLVAGDEDREFAGGPTPVRLPHPRRTNLRAAYVVRYAGATGVPRWAQGIESAQPSKPTALEVGPNGSIYFAGSYQSPLSLQPGGPSIVGDGDRNTQEAFVAALTARGVPRWVHGTSNAAYRSLRVAPGGTLLGLGQRRSDLTSIRFTQAPPRHVERTFLTEWSSSGQPRVVQSWVWADPMDFRLDTDGGIVFLTGGHEHRGVPELDGITITRVVPRVTTGSPPGPPEAFTALGGAGTVELAWAAPTSDGGRPITSYRLYRDGRVVQDLDPAVRTFTDRQLTVGVTYQYRLAAVNARGETPSATEPTAVPLGAPGLAPQLEWVRSIGRGNPQVVLPVSDGGGYSFGSRSGDGFSTDPLPIGADGDDAIYLDDTAGYLARFERDGGLAWVDEADGAYWSAGVIAADGDLVLAGHHVDGAVIEGRSSQVILAGEGLAVARYSPDGELRWASAGPAVTSAAAVAVDPSGEVTVVGGRSPASTGSLWDFAIAPTTTSTASVTHVAADGTQAWSLPIAGFGPDLGGSTATGVVARADGSTVVAGFYTKATRFGDGVDQQEIEDTPGSTDRGSFLLGLTPTGEVTQLVPSDGGYAATMAATPDGGVVVAGRHTGRIRWAGLDLDPPGGRGFVYAFDAALTPRWAHNALTWGVFGVAVAPDGALVVGGGFSDESSFEGTSGDVAVTARFPGVDQSQGGGAENIGVAEYDSAGNVRWAATEGANGNDRFGSVALTVDGDVLLGGGCQESWVRLGEPGRFTDFGRVPGPDSDVPYCGDSIWPNHHNWLARFDRMPDVP